MACFCSAFSSAHCSSVTAHPCSALNHANWPALKTTCQSHTHKIWLAVAACILHEAVTSSRSITPHFLSFLVETGQIFHKWFSIILCLLTIMIPFLALVMKEWPNLMGETYCHFFWCHQGDGFRGDSLHLFLHQSREHHILQARCKQTQTL